MSHQGFDKKDFVIGFYIIFFVTMIVSFIGGVVSTYLGLLWAGMLS